MINKELDELFKKKKMLENEIREIKIRIKNKKSKHNGNSVNRLTRVSNRFDDFLENVNKQREEIGYDKISKPKITELLVRHNDCKKIIEIDLINFNTNLETNRGIPQNVIAG